MATAVQNQCSTCGRALVGNDLCPVCSTDRIPEFDLDTIADPSIDAALDRIMPSEDADEASEAPFELRAVYTGRAPAIRQLLSVVERAIKESTLGFALLIGEPGMGKTATVRELARSIRDRRPDVRVLVGSADGASVLYAVFGRLLAARFGATTNEPIEESHDKIIAGVAEVMPPARVTEIAHLIGHLMRLPFPDSPIVGPLAEAPQQLEARTFLALRRFLAADAAAGPLVLCFENLELSEPESVNLLHYLVAGLSHSPVVILGTARSEALFDRHPSFGDVDTPLDRIELGSLDDTEVEELMRELCRPLDRIPPLLLAHARKLGGSPRALFEMMRYLIESDVVVRSGAHAWRADEAALSRAALPDSHEQLVAERVRVMPDVDRDVLEMAAVIGETFWMDGVVALIRVRDLETSDPDGPTLARIAAAGDQTRSSAAGAILRLIEREWIVEVEATTIPGEREFRFAYPYLWSTVYDGMATEKRSTYHRVVAQSLELRPQGRAAMAQEDVARHLELAGDPSAAAARYRRAADYARKSFFNERAIRLYSQALSCLGEADLATRIHLWHDLGSVYELKGDYEAALGG
ncbi:MAG TPA: AAA family ATPase, partial [Kofleriaceae bacterium]